MLHRVKAWLAGTPRQTERRRAPRLEAPASSSVLIKGQSHPLKNWSATGFLVSPYTGDVEEREFFNVRLEIRQDRESVTIDGWARAVRRDALGLAATFTSMSTEDRQRLDAHFDNYGLWLRVNG